jgi:hypothetical protein
LRSSAAHSVFLPHANDFFIFRNLARFPPRQTELWLINCISNYFLNFSIIWRNKDRVKSRVITPL